MILSSSTTDISVRIFHLAKQTEEIFAFSSWRNQLDQIISHRTQHMISKVACIEQNGNESIFGGVDSLARFHVRDSVQPSPCRARLVDADSKVSR